MKLKKEVRLNDGGVLVLRSLGAQDAAEALGLCRKAAGETKNLIRCESEWTMTPEEEAQYIVRMENSPKSLMIGAFISGRMAGIASFAPPSPVHRARHRATLGVSILRAYWGRGIGTAMMRTLVGAAKETNLEQLELEVVSTNARAIRLYERMGFVRYGCRPRGMKHRDGSYADMILMALDLTKKELC